MATATCAGGQYIFVVPQRELVAVFTGENYADGGTQLLPFSILQDDVVGAVTTP